MRDTAHALPPLDLNLVHDLSHRFLARLTQVDYAREMAFVDELQLAKG